MALDRPQSRLDPAAAGLRRYPDPADYFSPSLKDFLSTRKRTAERAIPLETKTMNKALLGLLLGGILGVFDGLTAWFTPAVRAQLLGIVIGSTVKGLIAGVLIGYFARKVNSLPLGIMFGLAVGLLLAYVVA